VPIVLHDIAMSRVVKMHCFNENIDVSVQDLTPFLFDPISVPFCSFFDRGFTP